MIRTTGAIIGRVMDHDKPAGYVFTEDDFLPKGTRAGLTAGIPAGKRAMRVPADKIPGLVGLVAGDRFDLVSTIPVDASNATSLAGGGLYGKQLELQARLSNWQKQATVRVVVQNGDVVQAMTTRQVPIANSTLTQGTIIRYKPVQEVVIAVGPSEVAKLSEALAVGADIECVPRSGRPDDPKNSFTPDSSPVSPFGGAVSLRSAPPPEDSSGKSPPASVTGSTPVSPVGGVFGNGFTQIETISGNKREIIAAPVKR
jgi:Flp pilus assembly protein CpaB